MRYMSIAFALVLTAALPAMAQLDDKVADRFWESTKILEQIVGAPDGSIPQDLLQRSECVGVIPAVKRAAFGIGGTYGRGLVTCRTEGGNGPWGTPSMISLGGGSFGFQIGGQSSDVLMLFVSPESIEFLLRDKVTLGADVAAAAGPKGREVSAATNKMGRPFSPSSTIGYTTGPKVQSDPSSCHSHVVPSEVQILSTSSRVEALNRSCHDFPTAESSSVCFG